MIKTRSLFSWFPSQKFWLTEAITWTHFSILICLLGIDCIECWIWCEVMLIKIKSRFSFGNVSCVSVLFLFSLHLPLRYKSTQRGPLTSLTSFHLLPQGVSDMMSSFTKDITEPLPSWISNELLWIYQSKEFFFFQSKEKLHFISLLFCSDLTPIKAKLAFNTQYIQNPLKWLLLVLHNYHVGPRFLTLHKLKSPF